MLKILTVIEFNGRINSKIIPKAIMKMKYKK